MTAMTETQAELLGRQAADLATGDEDSQDHAFPARFWLWGGILCGLSYPRDELRQLILDYVHERVAHPRRLPREIDIDRTDLRVDPVGIKSAREWGQELADAFHKHPAAVRRGVEEWIQEYMDDLDVEA